MVGFESSKKNNNSKGGSSIISVFHSEKLLVFALFSDEFMNDRSVFTKIINQHLYSLCAHFLSLSFE